jgi:hypothetical protein
MDLMTADESIDQDILRLKFMILGVDITMARLLNHRKQILPCTAAFENTLLRSINKNNVHHCILHLPVTSSFNFLRFCGAGE